jgi:hypothetical protein
MADDHADGTVVEGIVGCHVEEGHLQDSAGKQISLVVGL